jgi:hypothetical protein
MINSYLATNDLAPSIYFLNGPASNAYNSARWAIYNSGYTPTFEIDGLNELVGWTPATILGWINARLATPSYLSISQYFVGNASGGTVTYTLTAEQALGSTGEIKLWSAILEDHDIASSGYGLYAGLELMWEPRAWPCGSSGQVVTFTGPYPQTITVNKTYTLDPVTMTFSNLNAIAFVQQSTGNNQIFNASFIDLPDTNTGVYEEGTAPVIEMADLEIGPNPTSGTLNIYSLLPTGTSGNVSIFDLNGRIVDEFSAGGAVTTTIDTPGVYFVRMETSSGEILTRSCTVLR